jgi:hypothetical protein
MKTYRITTFRSTNHGVTDEYDSTWDEVVDFFTSGHTPTNAKEDLPLFNSIQYKPIEDVAQGPVGGWWSDRSGNPKIVRRKMINAIQVDMLIVDYDGGITIDQVKDRYSGYEYLGYTSYRHLLDGETHKFRLIFPLSLPIPSFTNVDEHGKEIDHGIFYDLEQSIFKFAPGSDPSAYNGIQPFYFPSAPPERIELATSWLGRGKFLDWTEWKVDQPVSSSTNSGVAISRKGINSNHLDPDQEFLYSKGAVKAKDVVGRIQKVACPFHGDTKGSEFLVRHDSGVVSFTCKHCGTFSMAPEIEVLPAKQLDADQSDESLVIYDDYAPYLDHKDREHIEKMLLGFKKIILSDTGLKKLSRYQLSERLVYQYKSHILYLPEGSGKSQLAVNFLADPPSNYFSAHTELYRNQIIFACKSWKQAMEQHVSFEPKLKAMGRRSMVAWSLDGAIQRRFNVKVRRSESNTFRPGNIIDDETISEIIEKNPHLDEKFIRLTWNILSESVRFSAIARPDIVSDNGEVLDDSDGDLIGDDFFDSLGDDPPAIIFTTFSQLRLVKAKKDHIPKNWIIWFDDPDVYELIDIKPVTTVKETNKARPIIDGTQYEVRGETMSLGDTFRDHRCIYATTERLTVRKLKHLLDSRKEKYIVHGERIKVTGGNITILGTRYVQKRYDALIPLISRRINVTEKKNLLLIANGIPAEFNHSTNKGRNDLSERDIIAEISHPHPKPVNTICDSLGLAFNSSRDEISKELMLDEMHQAIGRNSGFRTKGNECVVLVDANRHKYLVEECGYLIDQQNSVIIDRTDKMTRLDKRITESASPLVKTIEELLNNPHTYLADGRKIKPDIKYVVSTIPDPKKREDYLIRLLVSLTSHSKVRFDKPIPQNEQSGKVWKLGHWILDEYVPETRLKTVLTTYISELTPSKPSSK